MCIYLIMVVTIWPFVLVGIDILLLFFGYCIIASSPGVVIKLYHSRVPGEMPGSNFEVYKSTQF